MSRLARRLALLRSEGVKRQKEHAYSGVVLQDSPPGKGWMRVADFVWERSIVLDGLLGDNIESSFILPVPASSKNLLFYDLETTGLSGGAGNTAFLIGLGRQTDGCFMLTQLFLADYPGERAMLERFKALGKAFPYHVSYNGRSFDSQVLKARFLMNRLSVPKSIQVDLLYPSRRLWRGLLPDFSLKTLEANVLNIKRFNDQPGREAPEAWFAWLEGHRDGIDAVFRHNGDDITGLARLLKRLEDWGTLDWNDSMALLPPGTAASYYGISRQWAQTCQAMEEKCLESGWLVGDLDCGWEIARRMKRKGHFDQACAIWEKLDTKTNRNFFAAVELAKFLEHRQKNFLKAYQRIEGLDALVEKNRHQGELEHRRNRLRRKIRTLEES